ncbi:hypothetical protein [Cellulomonas hominis]
MVKDEDNPTLTAGYVESITPDRLQLRGWVDCGDSRGIPRLACFHRSTIVGTASVGPGRSDVRRARGVDGRDFIICLEAPAPEGALATGELRVVVVDDSGLVTGELSKAKMLMRDEATRLISLLAPAVPGVSNPEHGRVVVQRNSRPASGADLSEIRFPVGLLSSDGSVALGRDGHLFLVGGSNRLSDLYAEPSSREELVAIESLASSWRALFEERSAGCELRGVRYLQLVIPEKSTVMRRLLDGGEGETPRLREIERSVRDLPYYVSARDAFVDWSGAGDPWMRHDSHTSPLGALALMRLIVSHLDASCDALSGVSISRPSFYNGDLAVRLFGMDLWDLQLDPAVDGVVMTDSHPVLISAVDPSDGRHIGVRRVWRRDDAPLPIRVVVFGNSFFGRGANASRLSWWCARLFGEFHFIWSPSIDFDYVDAIHPDVVIGQTVERFLGQVPKA